MALGTALALAIWPTLKELVDPYIDAMNALPRVALVPLFIIWFGLGTLSKIVSGISLMYFILLYNTSPAHSRSIPTICSSRAAWASASDRSSCRS